MKTPSNYYRPKAAGTEEINPEVQDRNLTHLAIIIIFGIFATTLPQPQVLGRLPLQFFLKDQLHVDAKGMSNFFFWCGLAWYLKPFAGILTDAFPFFKTRRRHYMLFASVFAMLSWVAIIFVPKTYNSLLYTVIVINFFMVIASTVTGAYLVEAGQAIKATGRLTSVRQVVQNFCTLINGPFGGWLAGSAAAGSLVRTGAVNATLVLSLFPIAYIFLREKPVEESNSHEVLSNASKQLKTIFSSGTLWFALLFIGLFYFAPGFGTLMLYKQSDQLKFSEQQIGNLGIWSGGFGIAAALLYGYLIKRTNIKILILVGIVTNGLGTLLYIHYTSYPIAIAVESQNGFFFTLAEVSLMDLAARATPRGCEGLGYSLILSARNLCLFYADKLGAQLNKDHGWPLWTLILVNAGTTLLILPLLLLMPQKLMSSRDQPVQSVASDPDPTVA